MTKPYHTERRLFAAIQAYIKLLQTNGAIRAYSGGTRLYLMTGLGVTLSAVGDLHKLTENLAQDDILVDSPLSFVQQAIAANCVMYAKMLGEIVRKRLATRGTQDSPNLSPTSRRLSYNISIPLAQQIDRLVTHAHRGAPLWGQATVLQNLADMVNIEYAHVLNLNGMISPNPRQDATLEAFIAEITSMVIESDAVSYDPRAFHVPLLSIMLGIARLLYADFRDSFRIPPQGLLRERMWISNSTLAALPWPSPDFVNAFCEREAGMISSIGWLYLHHISSVYPDQPARAA